MIEPLFNIQNKFSADIINFHNNSIFAFDFKEEIFWISNTLDDNSAKKIAINMIKDSFNIYRISISKDLPIFSYISPNQTSAVVVDTQRAKVINSFKIQDSKIESVYLSQKGDTVLIGGKNGVLSRWDIFSGKLIDMPNKHKDSILFAKESINKRFVLSIGYDRSVLLFDKFKDKSFKLNCDVNATIRSAMFFDDCKFLALGDISGYIYIIDTDTKFMLNKFQATAARIVDICHYKDSYIFYLNSNGIIGIVDFSNGKRILDSFMPNNRYKSFMIEGDNIILSTQDNTVCLYSFKSFVDYGISLVDSNNIIEAYKFIEDNQFLKNEEFFLKLEARFQADLLMAKALACSNKQHLAIEILNKYIHIPSKNKDVSSLIANINSIDEFQGLMNSNMAVRAIPLTEKNPILKELKSYIDFEDRFKKVLMLAKELTKKGKKTDADTIMMQYKKMHSKIRIIQEVISYPQKVDEAISAIKAKDYKTYFRLKRNFKFVDSLQKSELIEKSGEDCYYELLIAFYSMDLENCKKYIEILKNFKQYKEFIMEMEFKIYEITNILEGDIKS